MFGSHRSPVRLYLYLYAIGEGIEHLDDIKGLCEESLAVIPVGHATVVAGWMTTLPMVSRESLMAQDTVVRALHARADALLPMRFGSSVADVDALIRLLDPLAAQVAERCALVRGREQMTIRVLRRQAASGASGAERPPSRPKAASARSRRSSPARLRAEADALGAGAKGAESVLGAEGAGTRYLAERAAIRTPRELAPLLTAVRDLQRATRIEQGRHSGVVATVYQLIDRGSSDTYRHRIGGAAAISADLTIRVSGPAPGYAFAALSAP